jgi:hypothetical protein
VAREYGLPTLDNSVVGFPTTNDVTCGNNVFGAWAQISAAVPFPLIVTTVGVTGRSTSLNAAPSIVELGYGAAGAEVPIGQVAVVHFSTIASNPSIQVGSSISPPLAFPTIPAGARIAIRGMADGASRLFAPAILGVRGDLSAYASIRQAGPGGLIGITWDNVLLTGSYQTLVTDGRACLVTDIAIYAVDTSTVVLAYGPAGAEHIIATIAAPGVNGTGQGNALTYPLPFPAFLPGGANLKAKNTAGGDTYIAVSGLRVSGSQINDLGAYGRGEGLGRYRIS